jgi:outer membrane protein OmpA-like peptidoglycan-associated protein
VVKSSWLRIQSVNRVFGLTLTVEGYTDSIGSDEYSQTLSDKRAEAERDYIVTSGVSMNNVVARGMGKADPAARRQGGS